MASGEANPCFEERPEWLSNSNKARCHEAGRQSWFGTWTTPPKLIVLDRNATGFLAYPGDDSEVDTLMSGRVGAECIDTRTLSFWKWPQ